MKIESLYNIIEDNLYFLDNNGCNESQSTVFNESLFCL